jgi:uncharacterized membrane protein
MAIPPKNQPVTGWQRTLVIRLDRAIYRLSRHWLAVFNVVVAIYVSLPMMAPVLMNAGITGPARAIYVVYSPMCHQMASRSFFLFGEQYAYPRELAGTGLQSLESFMDRIPEFVGVEPDNWVDFTYAARQFIGDERLGYKMALCERDIAIYGFVLIGGLVYAVLRRRYHIKPLPLVAFIIVGIGPIGLDGFSQLFGYWSTPIDGSSPAGIMAAINSVFALRESTPFLRTFTGGLFGFTLVWLAFPHINAGMKGTEQDLETKLQRIGELP